MKNLFFDLPNEIIRLIYSFDRTYREIYGIVLLNIPKFIECRVGNQYTNETYIYEYNNIRNYFYKRTNRNRVLQLVKEDF